VIIVENITKRKSENCYCVVKKVKGKVLTFGRFDTIEEAQMYRDYFRKHKWNIGLINVDKCNGVIDKTAR
jgi:hypothetical protein